MPGPYALGPAYPRDAAIQWGYNTVGVVLWFVLADDGTLILEDELVFNGPTKNKRVASQVAKLALERVAERGWTVRRWLINPQTAKQRGADGGEAVLETFQRAGLPVRPADDDRLNGWARLRAWLRTHPRTGKPFLRLHPRCTYTIRTIGAVIQDDGKPEDVNPAGECAAVNALRYEVQGRPSPSLERPVKHILPGTVGELVQKLRRDAEPTGRILGQPNKSRRGSWAR